MIIVSSYTANLAAFLTLEKMTPPIEVRSERERERERERKRERKRAREREREREPHSIFQFDDHRRFSRGSEFDSQSLNRAASTKSHSGGAAASGGKIGSFFRKIGAGRPPGAAASLVSLNKVGYHLIV